ncbi:uncharacterized protein JCM15063_000785 [Sporobolomyces koalae]|uniref:uncharacterized protein n=1 Tax=Sporobolomyces koalae TaxID=500713 RepID=UPI003178D0CC
MLADLDLALKQPLTLIEKLYVEGGSTLDGFELRVEETFRSLVQDARDQLPAITALTDPARLPRPGSLVRFRAMVQDTGYGSELYRALGTRNQLLMYGIEEAEEGSNASAHEDYSKLRERQLFYIVSPPGETDWVKQSLDNASNQDLEAGLSRLSLSSSTPPNTSRMEAQKDKAPLPHEPHFGLIAKFYTDFADKLRSTDVYEFVGIIGETPLSNAFEVFENGQDSTPAQVVPALHVLYTLSPTVPVQPTMVPESTEFERTRQELLSYIAHEGTQGDLEAAEWVLLALIARIHTRHATGLALGSLSVNLSFPIGAASASTGPDPLTRVLSTLVPALASISPTITSLNDPSTRFSPRSRDETLDAGQLQLPRGTNVVLDLQQLGEGKLNDTGVRNLRSLSTTIAQQKLAYEFPFSSFELETDLGFVVVSEGKAIVPTDCVIYVEPSPTSVSASLPTESRLNEFRALLYSLKHSDFKIPEHMSSVIQADFVERRQNSHAGPGTAMTQEDLLFRMTVSRLVALSWGKKELDEISWSQTAVLDERRKERIPEIVIQREEELKRNRSNA